ncbi:homeobox-like domain superfamily [Holotrichia oblita]|uniref:Homeobox-like domain superfamily n=1 Tax=Holotrichia oblita TaxID=644536 RepID=A0ACB9SVY7_HOLOL|nr:homeobox-like domain superfamily [Holotrichia oblita]
MPRSKQGIKRSPVNEIDLGAAVEDVLKNKTTVYSAAKKYSISKTTLLRHIKTFKASELNTFTYRKNNDVNKVFSDEEENLLVEYILKASHLQ